MYFNTCPLDGRSKPIPDATPQNVDRKTCQAVIQSYVTASAYAKARYITGKLPHYTQKSHYPTASLNP